MLNGIVAGKIRYRFLYPILFAITIDKPVVESIVEPHDLHARNQQKAVKQAQYGDKADTHPGDNAS